MQLMSSNAYATLRGQIEKMLIQHNLRKCVDMGNIVGKGDLKVLVAPVSTSFADLKKRKIVIGSDAVGVSLEKMVAHILHEAGHIRYTKLTIERAMKIIKDTVQPKTNLAWPRRAWINAIEDARIEYKLSKRYPNGRALLNIRDLSQADKASEKVPKSVRDLVKFFKLLTTVPTKDGAEVLAEVPEAYKKVYKKNINQFIKSLEHTQWKHIKETAGFYKDIMDVFDKQVKKEAEQKKQEAEKSAENKEDEESKENGQDTSDGKDKDSGKKKEKEGNENKGDRERQESQEQKESTAETEEGASEKGEEQEDNEDGKGSGASNGKGEDDSKDIEFAHPVGRLSSEVREVIKQSEKITDEVLETLNRQEAEIKRQETQIKSVIQQLLQELQPDVKRNRERGKIDTNKLWKAGIKKDDFFKAAGREFPETDIIVMSDISGSTRNGNIFSVISKATQSLMEAFDKFEKIKSMALFFNGNSYVGKTFRQKGVKFPVEASGGTNFDRVIFHADKMLKKEGRGKKEFMLMITDGLDNLSEARKKLAEQHNLYAIIISSSATASTAYIKRIAEENFGKNFCVIGGVSELGGAIAAAFKTFIRG